MDLLTFLVLLFTYSVQRITSRVRWMLFDYRGVKLLEMHMQNGNPTTLSQAIINLQNALVLCPPGYAGRPRSLNNLAHALHSRYEEEGNLDDLTRAIQHLEEALSLNPPGSRNRSTSLNNLAVAIEARYEREGSLDDLTRVIQCHEEALDLSPFGHPDRPKFLKNLATAIHYRYDREGSLHDLTCAMLYYEEALDLCPLGHPDRHRFLNGLAMAIRSRYEREGNLDDLTRAIQYTKKVLDLRPPGHPDRSTSLDNLASVLLIRYEREGNLGDLTRAIQYREEDLNLCPPGKPARYFCLNGLATTVLTRYQQDGNLDDLTHAIQLYEQALDLNPPGHRNRPTSLNNLALAVHIRYEREGKSDDLTRVVQHHKEALGLRPPGHPDRVPSLSNLASVVLARYQREGCLDDLTHAILYTQEALNLLPPRHSGRFRLLNNLASALQIRYEREGNSDDLTSAIRYDEEVLNILPLGHLDRPSSLVNLALAIQTRYQREGGLDDITRAIQYHEEALSLCPPGHSGRYLCLNNLGYAIHTRYMWERDFNDLTRAIRYYQEALNLLPLGQPLRHMSLNNLATVFYSRYEREGNLDDLTRTIQYYEEVLDLLPPGHPHRSNYMRGLASALQAQYYRTERVDQFVNFDSRNPGTDTFRLLEHVDRPSLACDSQDSSQHRIISLLREASQSTSCSPRDCLKAALDWVKISKDLAPSSTLEAYETALDQLDLALALSQSLDQRHNHLLSDETSADTKALSVEAATWALQHGELERAVELLERGRSLLFAQIGRYRVELNDLRLANPGLADRFTRLSQLLDTSIVSSQEFERDSSTIHDPYERYRKRSTEWTQTVDEIRNIEGFETFLKPISYDLLRQAAAEGPVIMIIPHQKGSTALIIHNDRPIHRIDLPKATSTRLADLSHDFIHLLNYKDYNATQRERECADKLASLWNELVGPIAQALQDDLAIPLRSRVWWCPASAACFLPLHAAGLYAKGKAGENFSDKYTSSYTPTLQAVLRARQTNTTPPKKLLVISQPHTPGEPPLPYAQVEADTIAEIVSSAGTGHVPMMTPLSSEAGARELVQREMASHPWIHFICHGVQAANRPLDSYLSLHDGHLTVRNIIKQDLPNADFAFLAACHSAAGDKDLANEALHLAAAMQFAGFRGVVGTLWKMRDDDGPPLAEAFYRDMLKHGDHRRAAVALRKAINHLRRSKVPIHCWMRFIHIGA